MTWQLSKYMMYILTYVRNRTSNNTEKAMVPPIQESSRSENNALLHRLWAQDVNYVIKNFNIQLHSFLFPSSFTMIVSNNVSHKIRPLSGISGHAL